MFAVSLSHQVVRPGDKGPEGHPVPVRGRLTGVMQRGMGRRNGISAKVDGGHIFVTIQLKKTASGGKVCHLESWLRMRFAPRSSGQITSVFVSAET